MIAIITGFQGRSYLRFRLPLHPAAGRSLVADLCRVGSSSTAVFLHFGGFGWVLVKEFNGSHHNKETILFNIDPYYGSLNYIL